MAPALRIPVSLDLNSLKDQTKQASDRVGETLKLVGQAFKQVNGEMLGIASATASGVALGWAQSATAVALRFALMGTTAVVAFKAIGAIIDQTREQLKAMVDVADKAGNSTNTPEFFQKFVAESQKLKVGADDMEAALTHAFDATKEKSPIDVGKWEVADETITDIEKSLRVYNTTAAKAAGTQLQGLVLFRDAQNQDDKVMAVLTAMTELDKIGQNLAALDIGEKMFGSQFVDRIRQGKTSAEGILSTMQAMSVANGNIFPDSLVQRAKEMDDKLKESQQRLDREMRPSWNALAGILLTIKGYWADIIDSIATVAATINRIDLLRVKDELAQVQEAIKNNTALYGLPQLPSGREALLKREIDLQKQLDDLEGRSRTKVTIHPESRGTGAAPTEKKDANSDGRDRFDSASDNVDKRTASLNAETANIDLNTQARERARIVAELETVAKQANATAGLGENVITAEQRDRINEVADAYGKAALAIENARSPLATFARESANVNKALNQFAASGLETVTNNLADVVTGTKIAAEAFKSMATSIINDLARIAIRQSITGPIAGALFGGPTGAAGGILGSIFGGARADGGPVEAGKAYLVNENTPNSELFVPGQSGMIVPSSASPSVVPNDVVGRSGANPMTLRVSVSLDNEMLRAVVTDESGRVISQATPHIVGAAVTQSAQQVPGLMQEAQMRQF